jgi:hypothetical protein
MRVAYADVEYLDDVYFDAEFLHGKWWIFERKTGDIWQFALQDRVKPLNDLQPRPRQPKLIPEVRRSRVTDNCAVMRIPVLR